MPTVSPLYGAEDAPVIDAIIGSANSTVDVSNASSIVALESIDVAGAIQFKSFEQIDIRKSQVEESQSEIDIGYENLYESLQGIDVLTGQGFLILADLVQEELAGVLGGEVDPTAQHFVQLKGRLMITNDAGANLGEPLIKSFTFSAPTGRLGTILNVRLARPTESVIPAGTVVNFSIQVTINGTVAAELILMKKGRLQEKDNQIAMSGRGPNDEVSFGATDVIADKFTLGPRRPVVMFDPVRIRYDNVQTRNDQLIRTESRGLIQPSLEPVNGLTMRQVLDRAYSGNGGSVYITSFVHGPHSSSFTWPSLVTLPEDDQKGCGFDRVITNIPDYPMRRADFTIEGGWHEGTLPAVSMFAPVYFVHDNTLFILDVEQSLPRGITPVVLHLNQHKSLNERIEFKPETNAVLLTYQYNANDPSEDPAKVHTDKFTDETVDEQGTEGTIGYSKVTVRRWDRVFYLVDTPDQILDTLPLETQTETSQTIAWYDTSGVPFIVGTKVTHQETITYTYDGDIKTGYTKVTKAAIADPQSSFIFQLREVENETCVIDWAEDTNNPGLKLQSSVRTDIDAVCTFDPGATESVHDPDLGDSTFVRLIPVLQAQASGIITSSWKLTGLIPVKSIRETLQNMKGNQYDVEVIETDYLNNTRKRSYTQPVTGSVQNDPYEAKSRTVLLRDTTSETAIGKRIPMAVNALELPREQAIALGKRVLNRLKNPLKTLPVQFPGVVFGIQQGSVVKGQKRDAQTGNYFVTGFTITGENLGTVGHKISQSLECVEIGTKIT